MELHLEVPRGKRWFFFRGEEEEEESVSVVCPSQTAFTDTKGKLLGRCLLHGECLAKRKLQKQGLEYSPMGKVKRNRILQKSDSREERKLQEQSGLKQMSKS
ncbi:hypothetical protein RUM44_003625 [Polyplax serrata]|uniref:Uncharacterized protein n=1 Tax=Polyplax serrata TaxID=468196 RepID=A0ABR1AH04_POLSC